MDWMFWLGPVIFAGMLVLALVGGISEARHRSVLAYARRVEWQTMVDRREGDVASAAIDYRAKFGAWPGDWNNF